MKLIADKISLRGPNVDNGWKVTFDIGEFQKPELAKLLSVPDQTEIHLEVTW